MLLKREDFKSQFTLLVTTTCSFSCTFCPLWQKDMYTQAKLPLGDIMNDRFESIFFERYPWKRLYNIVGGEPTMFPDLLKLLRFLKKSGIKIRLWTHGAIPDAELEALLPWVDFFALYIINADETMFSEITGHPKLEDVKHTLLRLKESNHPRLIHSPVRPELVEWLPDLKELAQETSTYLYLHVYKYQRFSADEEEHVRYFNNLPFITVTFYGKQTPEHLCAGLPYWVMPETLPDLKKQFFNTIFHRKDPLRKD